MRQQSFARRFDLVENGLEALSAAEIRIDYLAPRGMGRELHQQTHTLAALPRANALQVAQIRFVHRQQQIEAVEIRRGHLPRA